MTAHVFRISKDLKIVKNFLAVFVYHDNFSFVNAETDFLKLLIKTCRAARDPKRPGSRTEMAIPAAQWEVTFQKRLHELEKAANKRATEPLAA
jgi:hypothetical protein